MLVHHTMRVDGENTIFEVYEPQGEEVNRDGSIDQITGHTDTTVFDGNVWGRIGSRPPTRYEFARAGGDLEAWQQRTDELAVELICEGPFPYDLWSWVEANGGDDMGRVIVPTSELDSLKM